MVKMQMKKINLVILVRQTLGKFKQYEGFILIKQN